MKQEIEKNYHIDVLDYKGNQIVCDGERWADHVIGKGKRRHRELDGLEELIISALQKPATGLRYFDTNYPNRISYYGNGAFTRYIKVVVEFTDNQCTGKGFIVTTFPVNNMKPMEKPEW